MPLNLLLAWWNLVYIIPFVLALFYLGLFVFTGLTFGEADADADVDADAQVHIEAHVAEMDSDAGVHLEHDIDADHDVDADQDAEVVSHNGVMVHPHSALGTAVMPHAGSQVSVDTDTAHASFSHAVLSFLGVGKIPLSLALMILLLCWGAVGFALNALLASWLGNSVLIPLISLPLTLAISLTLTGLCAAVIAKIIPADDSGTRQRKSDLVGKSGEAIYDIDSTFGMASVRGNAGDFFQIPCRTALGKNRIPKGSRIVIFDYDRDKGVFHVALFDA